MRRIPHHPPGGCVLHSWFGSSTTLKGGTPVESVSALANESHFSEPHRGPECHTTDLARPLAMG